MMKLYYYDNKHMIKVKYEIEGEVKHRSFYYGNNKGIVPLACEEIFRRINERNNNPENNI